MTRMRRRGVCLVVAAPSGAGKSTIVKRLLDTEPELTASVSVTTRQPRPGELEGRDYYYRSNADFGRMVESGEMLEHAMVFGRGYGTPRAPILAALEGGRDVVLDIDWQGWRQIRARLPDDTVGVFVLPPSMPVLAERLRGRGSDGDDEVRRRMAAARGEVLHWAEFDHVVINDALPECVDDVRAVLRAARCTVSRNVAARQVAAAMIDGLAG